MEHEDEVPSATCWRDLERVGTEQGPTCNRQQEFWLSCLLLYQICSTKSITKFWIFSRGSSNILMLPMYKTNVKLNVESERMVSTE